MKPYLLGIDIGTSACKAAVFSAKAAGVADQGAVAGAYMIQGLKRGLAAL